MSDAATPAALLRRFAALLLPLFALLVWAGFPASLWFQQQQPPRAIPWSVVGTAVLFALVLGWASLRWLTPWLQRRSLPVHVAGGLLAPLAIGLLLRLLLSLWLAPQPASDGATYVQLGRLLAAGEDYAMGGTRAYWPPGLPLLLAPLFQLSDSTRTVLTLVSLLVFAVAAVGMHRLSLALGLAGRAVLPVWLLALWPNHLLMAGVAEKEGLVLALLPWVVLGCWRAWDLKGRSACLAAVVAGALLGLAVLVQPSMQLLPPALAIVLVLLAPQAWRKLGLVVVMLLAMLLVVSPWTWRNWQVLGTPLLVSSNGGSNFYRANNPLATGGYMLKGEVDVDALGELRSSAEGMRLAKAWIAAHPADFARLSAGKIMLFGGDHSVGAFVNLRLGQAGQGAVPAGVYYAAKLACAVPWLLLWLAIGLAAWRAAWTHREAAQALIVGMPFAYLGTLHAVFESNGKYHLPTLAVVLVLGVWLMSRRWGRP